MFACISVTRVDSHSHGTDSFAVGRGLVLRKINQRIIDNPNERVRRIYDGVITVDLGDSDDEPNFSGLQT
jgi:hypothetical protein